MRKNPVETSFTIDSRLLNNTHKITDLPLCQLFIQNDTRFLWFVLVPRIADVTELYQLTDADQVLLLNEISRVSRYLKEVLKVYKINVGALGNIVPQLHIHIVGRNVNDAAWPGPVWGVGAAEHYSFERFQTEIQRIQRWLEVN